MTNAEMNIGDFWGFVVSRYAHRNARGEFIRAVRRMVSEGADPEAWMEGDGLRFAREARGLRLEYGRKMAREFGTAGPDAVAVRPAIPPPWSSEKDLTAGRVRGNSTRASAVPAETGKPAEEPRTP